MHGGRRHGARRGDGTGAASGGPTTGAERGRAAARPLTTTQHAAEPGDAGRRHRGAGVEVGVLPCEDGGDECFVRGAVWGEFGLDQAAGVVEHEVLVAHRCSAASSWWWSPGPASEVAGAVWARKRA
ncbi:hypothetical protein EAO76_42385 [Streptomyces sp. sk2.1]|nr:hypothetical protein EAO76_42385 [Streptomyces sp. sk2.1]